MDEEFNLFGGNMLSEEQFHKMMADEHVKMQQEAALRSNVPTEQQDMKDLGRNFQQMEQDLKRDQNEGQNKTPEEVLKDQDTPQAPVPAPGNKVAQLRFLPRGAVPNELPYTPSPPLVPEVTPKLPTPLPRGPFKPLPDGQPGPGEPPLAPPRQLPSPPRPRLDANASPFKLAAAEPGEFWTPPMPSPFDAAMDKSVAKTRDWRYHDSTPATPWEANEFDTLKSWQKQKRDGEIPPAGMPFPDPPSQPNDAALPPNARQTAGEGEAYAKFKAEIEQARKDAAAPKEHSPIKDFFGEALNTAMAVGPGGAPRGSPFARSIPRSEGQMSPNEVAPRSFTPTAREAGETVASPAVRINQGKVYSGTDHGDAWVNAGEPNVSYSPTNRAPDQHFIEDGWLTSTGRFVNKFEALELGKAANQVKPERLAEIEANPGDRWNYRLNSEDVTTPIATRGQGAATYTPRDEGQLSPNARVKRGFGDVGSEPPQSPIQAARAKGADELPAADPNTGRPIPPQARLGRPTNASRKAMDIAEEANPRQPTDQGAQRQGFRQYGTDQGEIGPKDRALRSVRRTEGVPPEEAQTKNLERFPPGYFDRVPRERRQMGAGLSHPGFRWQIMENGSAIGTPQMNKLKASQRADKMTSTYNTRYTVAPRPAGESELTPSERSYLQKYEINIPRNTQ